MTADLTLQDVTFNPQDVTIHYNSLQIQQIHYFQLLCIEMKHSGCIMIEHLLIIMTGYMNETAFQIWPKAVLT